MTIVVSGICDLKKFSFNAKKFPSAQSKKFNKMFQQEDDKTRIRKTKKLDLLSNLIGGKYQVYSFRFFCSDMIFKYLWNQWINKIELKMILYFFPSCALSHVLNDVHILFAQSFCIRKTKLSGGSFMQKLAKEKCGR